MVQSGLKSAVLSTTALVALWTGSSVHAETNRYLNLPAQPLAAAIEALSAETGHPIAVNKSVLGVAWSTPVSGRVGTKQALEFMLADTSLKVLELADGSLVVVPPNGAEIVSQDAVGEDFELPPIIVRGELQERELQDVQTSVTVETGESLERRGDRNIRDIAERAPNVGVSSDGSFFTIRGITQNQGGGGPTVSVQVDGIETQDNTRAFATWDVDQVEILRGPQSTQQGRNALAGAIIVSTNDPIYVNEYRLRGTLETGPLYEGAFVVNQVLSEDKAAVRVSGQVSRDDGDVENTTLDIDDADPTDLDEFRAKLRLDPSQDLSVLLSYSYHKTRTGVSNILGEFFPSDRLKDTPLDEFNETESDTFSLELGYDISPNLKVVSETSYRLSEGAQLLGIVGGSNFSDRDGTTFEQDLRLQFDGAGYSGVFGLFYYKDEFTADNVGTTNGAFIGLPPFVEIAANVSSTTQRENYAIFGEIEAEADRLLPGLSFVVGARYDWERQERKDSRDVTVDSPFPLPPLPFGSENSEVEAEFDAFLPKIGAIYEWREGMTTSLTYQQGYRAGGTTSTPDNPFETQVDFDPEYTRNIEFAFRGEFLEGDLITNANVFYTRWVDQQVVRDSGFGPFTIIENAGESELYGAELSVNYRATAALDLFLDLGYLQTEYIDYVTGNDDFTGNEFANAPTWTGAVGGSYAFASGVTLGVDASYTGEAFDDPDNAATRTLEERFLVNANVTYEIGGLLAGAYVRNLFDVDYHVSRDDLTQFARAGDPRSVGAFLEYRF
ncbi:MAG: TonB-dependent receptor [Pseudomonadota bacterium]